MAEVQQWSENRLFFSYVIPGLYPDWLHHWGLSSWHTAPPATAPASTFPLSSPHYLWASLGGDTVPRGSPEPARLGPSLSLHERWRVLLTPPADRGGEDGGLVPEHGERSRGERTSGGEWVREDNSRWSLTMNNSWVSQITCVLFPSQFLNWFETQLAVPRCSCLRKSSSSSASANRVWWVCVIACKIMTLHMAHDFCCDSLKG